MSRINLYVHKTNTKRNNRIVKSIVPSVNRYKDLLHTEEQTSPSSLMVVNDRKEISDTNLTVVIQGTGQETDLSNGSEYVSTGTLVGADPEETLTA
jgi:hypothetical protein